MPFSETIHDAILLSSLPVGGQTLLANQQMISVADALVFSTVTAGQIAAGDTATIGGTAYSVSSVSDYEAELTNGTGSLETVSGKILHLDDGAGGTLTYMLFSDDFLDKPNITQAVIDFVSLGAFLPVAQYSGNDIVTIKPPMNYVVEGSDGADYIDTGYTGDPGGDRVDANDNAAGSNDDVIDAGGGNDTVYAGLGNDSVLGGLGDDSLLGGDGNDTLLGGDGNDVLEGQLGDDSMVGGAGHDRFYAHEGDDTIIGGEGNDTVEAHDGNDLIYGDAGNDSLIGQAGDDTIYGGAGNDFLQGSYGEDVIIGGTGDDYLWGGYNDDLFIIENDFGNDTIAGEDVDEINGDTVDFSAVTNDLWLDLSNGNPKVGTYSDGVSTGQFSEVEHFILGAGRDTVVLGNGSGLDSVIGFAAPILNGDGSYSGQDQIDVTGILDFDLNQVNTADVVVTDDGSGNAVLTFPNGEALTLIGVAPTSVSSPAALIAMGVPATDGIISGTAGDDLIDAGYVGDNDGDVVDGADAHLSGQVGDDDIILAGDGDDTVLAGNGDDSVEGGAGYDHLSGGAGNDTLMGGDGDDTLDGGIGDDLLSGGAGSDSFAITDASFGNDTIIGGADLGQFDVIDLSGLSISVHVVFTAPGAGTISNGTSTITFSEIERLVLPSGNDLVDLSGDSGGIVVWAGAGSDTLIGSDGYDMLLGEGGADSISGGLGGDFLDGDAGNDTLLGGAGNDTLYGDEDDDSLSGGDGDDLIYGGVGADTLQGGAGADQLFGQAGNDVFELGSGDTASGGAGDDVFNVGPGALNGTALVVDGGETGETGGDVLNITGPATISYDAGNPENGTVEWLDGTTLTFSNIETVNYVPCFTPDVRIKTIRGEVPAGQLRVGDRVLTRDHGYQSIRWVGMRDLSRAEVMAAPQLGPVCIGAGALGRGLPARDMMVSPQHRVLVGNEKTQLWFGADEVLVSAVHLSCVEGIEQMADRAVSYVHFMFDHHEIVSGDGVWSESFQPGDKVLQGMDRAQRDELFVLFPELRDGGEHDAYSAARMTLRAYEVALVI